MNSQYYFGFSSKNVRTGFDTSLKGIELVKRDLLNHFETSQYERVGRPNFYCLIEDMLFAKGDNALSLARQEAERVFRSDPRVTPKRLDAYQYGNKIVIRAILNFVQFNMDDLFSVTFGEDQ